MKERSALGLDRKWWVLIAVGTGTFMSALDTSVVNVILPTINQAFGSTLATIEWVITIYLLVVSGLLLTFGRLGDLRGHKQIYLLGFIIFITGSASCGLAPSEYALIAFRGYQALGAAMLAANSPAILTKNFPAEQRGQALGMQATMTYLGLTVAPSFGGWLTDAFSWHAVFFINVPVGLLALYLGWHFIPKEDLSTQHEHFDWVGAILFMAGLVALLFGLNQGDAWGWTSPLVLGLLGASIILLAIFVYWELRQPEPMLDLSLFKERIFSASVTSAVLIYISLFGIIFLMPFYLIQGRGFNISYAGLILTAQPVIMAITAPLGGTWSDRIGVRVPKMLGMGILVLGLFLLSRLGLHSSLAYIALGLAISGLGIGLFISPNTSAIMGSAPHDRQGIASGVLATARSVGQVLGVGFAGAIFTTNLAGVRVEEAGPALYPAIRISLLAACGVAVLGFLTTTLRGRIKENR